jgi:hypothetical protein
MAVRRRRTCAVAASTLVAMAIAVPSEAAAADTTPPSAPTNATWFWDNCYGFFANWRSSTDNVDGPADLRYRFYRDGRLVTVFSNGGGTEAQGSASGDNWALVERGPDTVRAVDRAGNVSAPAAVTEAR